MGVPLEWLPSQMTAVVSLGIGLAFLIADIRTPTSRALGGAFVSFAVAVGLGMPLSGGTGPVTEAGRWLALCDGLALVLSIEWVVRVRRTIEVEPSHAAAVTAILRVGQLAGVWLGAAGVLAPEMRRDEFVGAVNDLDALVRPGFWLFGGPILVAIVAGAAGTLLLLVTARPDRAERLRIVAAVVAFPLIVIGLVLPMRYGALITVAGEMIFLIGTVRYLILQGQRGLFMTRFLSPQVARLVRERGLRQAVKHRSLEITVIASDLRGFTAFAQAHPSSSVIKTLREYYDAVGRVVSDYGGTVKDYAGDGILILVGAPLPVPNHGRSGYEMALLIREAATAVTRRWSMPGHPLGVGVGVASGRVTVGIIGSASRWEYTAVGPAVNLASRLCELAADGEILFDARTVELAGSARLEARRPATIKGFAEPVALWAARD